MIKAIIFDFDDTLVQTKTIRYKAIKYSGKMFYNIDIKDTDIDEQWGKPFEEFLYQVFKRAADYPTLFKNYKSILDNYPNEAFPNTEKVLEILRKKYELGVISSSHKELILTGMANVGIKPELFRFIQSADETTVHKPNPEVFAPSISAFSVDGAGISDILYIGDTLDDFNSAINAGLHFCGIADRTTVAEEFRKVNASYITNIEQLPQHIQQVEKKFYSRTHRIRG